MWTAKNRGRYDRSKLRYPSDLTDDEWFDMRPFIVGQVTRISQFAAVVTSAVLRRPHRGASLESGHHFESQTIQRIQNVFGRTLRREGAPSNRERRRRR